jgi:hypothetical protein
LSTQQQLEATLALFHQTRDHVSRLQVENKNSEQEIQNLQKMSTTNSLTQPPSPSPAPPPLQISDEKLEIQRLEGRLKYYQEQLDEQRQHSAVMNEHLLKSQTELFENKEFQRKQEQEFIETLSQNKELKRILEELRNKVTGYEVQMKEMMGAGAGVGVGVKNERRRIEPPATLSPDEVGVDERRRYVSSSDAIPRGVAPRDGGGYFDESESTIEVGDELRPFGDQMRGGGGGRRARTGARGDGGRGAGHQLTQHERGAAEIISSILVEEMQHSIPNGKKIQENVLYEVSVKVALRLLCDARKGREGSDGLSLLELLEDRRFLADLVADTQVVSPLDSMNKASFIVMIDECPTRS